MNKPYVYLDRYTRDGFLKPLRRLIPTAVGSHVRVAFHGVGDGSRSLEVYVQPNGWWSVEAGPGLVSSGERTVLARGRLPGEWGPEEFALQLRCATSDTYAAREVLDQVWRGPYPGEDFHRLKVTGDRESKWLSVSPRVLEGLARLIEMDERGELS